MNHVVKHRWEMWVNLSVRFLACNKLELLTFTSNIKSQWLFGNWQEEEKLLTTRIFTLYYLGM